METHEGCDCCAKAWGRGATPRPSSGAAVALFWSNRKEIPTSKVRETQVRQWALRKGIRGQTSCDQEVIIISVKVHIFGA